MNYESGKASTLDLLKQKNRNSLGGIEASLGETKIISIPTQVRESEMELLRTAVDFQPELYERIDEIPTREEMDKYMEETLNIDMNYYQKTVDAYRKELTSLKAEIVSEMKQTEENLREIQSQMQESIEQAGKNQENYMNKHYVLKK